MDRLLDKLRQNMAELSVQGDDFTRQIWHMYATFEEFVDTRSTLSTRSDRTSRTASWPTDPPELRRFARTEPSAPTGPMWEPGGEPSEELPGEPPGWGTTGREGHVRRRRPARSLRPSGRPASEDQEGAGPSSLSPLSRSLERRSRDTRGRDRVRPSSARHRRLHEANPLLETIGAIQAIQALQDGADDDERRSRWSPPATPARERRLSGSRFFSDGERDSSGYAGSNSVDSGYKSSCPTPEPADSMLYASHPRGPSFSVDCLDSLASQRPRIAMGIQVMNRQPRSGRERDLDELIFLRQSILTAMQRYEEPMPGGMRGRVGSGGSGPPCPGPGPGPGPGVSSGARTRSPASSGTHSDHDLDYAVYARLVHRTQRTHRAHRSHRAHRAHRATHLLRDMKHGDNDSSSSDGSPPRSAGRSPPVPPSAAKISTPTNRSPPDGRFSEVAQCMLEIIEDLQSHVPVPTLPQHPQHPQHSQHPQGAFAGSEQHVYEEIVYDVGTTPRVPPPLPARPAAIFRAKPRDNVYSRLGGSPSPPPPPPPPPALQGSKRGPVPAGPEPDSSKHQDEYGFIRSPP